MCMKSSKLVRDKIPDLIRSKGKEPVIRVASDWEYAEALREKLLEEVNEYLTREQPEEIADILEVLDAISVEKGFSMEDILERKRMKYEDRGGFEGKIMLEI